MFKLRQLGWLCTLIVAMQCGQPAHAQGMPVDIEFRQLRNGKLLLRNCPLVSGLKGFTITDGGRAITPPAGSGRDKSRLDKRYRFFACQTVAGSTSLFVKETSEGAVSQLTFELSDFPKKKNGLSRSCPAGTRGLGFGVLYKPAADAADARQGKPVVLLQGGNKTRGQALRIFASNGAEICKFSFKAPDTSGINGGSDHYYSGWFGGCGRTASQIAGAARAASGSTSIYIESTGGSCLGPVNPGSRTGGIGG